MKVVGLVLKDMFGDDILQKRGVENMQKTISEFVSNDPILRQNIKKIISQLSNVDITGT